MAGLSLDSDGLPARSLEDTILAELKQIRWDQLEARHVLAQLQEGVEEFRAFVRSAAPGQPCEASPQSEWGLTMAQICSTGTCCGNATSRGRFSAEATKWPTSALVLPDGASSRCARSDCSTPSRGAGDSNLLTAEENRPSCTRGTRVSINTDVGHSFSTPASVSAARNSNCTEFGGLPRREHGPSTPSANFSAGPLEKFDKTASDKLVEDRLSKQAGVRLGSLRDVGVKSPLVGLWVDPDGSFMDGNPIELTETSWRSMSPPEGLEGYSTVMYTPINWLLIERQASGEERQFSISPGANDTLVVKLVGENTTWVLHRHVKKTQTISLLRQLLATNAHKNEMSRPSSSILKPSGVGMWMTFFAKKTLALPGYDYAIGLIIFLNTLTMGIESELEYRGYSPRWLKEIEHMFLVFYLLEIAIHLLAKGRRAFKSSWFIFDFLLVCSGVTATWIFEPLIEDSPDVLQGAMVIRMARLLRLLRALRVTPAFKTSWRLVYGILTSSGTMISTLMLLLLLLYVFAFLGMELITKSGYILENQVLVNTYFSGIATTMLTLVQFVSLDSIASIYFPLIKEKWYLVFYFAPILLLISIALMNLVTAVIVERAMDQAKDDQVSLRQAQIAKVRNLAPIFRSCFKMLDQDDNGNVSRTEIEKLDLSCMPLEVRENIKVESVVELFDILDANGSGTLSELEFVEGLLNMCLSSTNNVPPEVLLMLKLIRSSRLANTDMKKLLSQVYHSQLAFQMNIEGLFQQQVLITKSEETV